MGRGSKGRTATGRLMLVVGSVLAVSGTGAPATSRASSGGAPISVAPARHHVAPHHAAGHHVAPPHAARHRTWPPPHRSAPRPGRSSEPTALSRRGMWIWYLSKTEGGDLSAIVARAKAHGIGTLFIKSGDGTGAWSQFSASVVRALHAAGLSVCAWQYVYGSDPVAEAAVGAQSVAAGADCLVIDAEGEYEGRYVQAQQYITTLRAAIGTRFPLALAALPYVDYHPSFPYSVFLGPGGAQSNLPQMYWADIGTTPDSVYAHTLNFNAPYGRHLYPLGEVTGSPSSADVLRFRELSLAYRTAGLSWWDWQEAGDTQWAALSAPIATSAGITAEVRAASVGRGALGDLVVWAQQHLISAGEQIGLDGVFGADTQRAVRRFQAARALGVTGVIDATTWSALLRYPAAFVHWWLHPSAHAASDPGRRAAVRAARVIDAPVPVSARAPDRGRDTGPAGRG